MFRVGHGFDVHALVPGDHVILGGINIPHDQGLLAHSDGDVLLHAICDACLGAAGLGDIGRHFPDTDERYQGIASTELLAEVFQKIRQAGYVLGNLDATVVAQRPKLSPYLDDMKAVIAKVLDTEVSQLNLKATTTERLGYTGREEGIAAHAVVLLIDR